MTKHILKPKCAATLLILKAIEGKPFVLMGKRHEAHIFMPDFYVFPGGKMDRADFSHLYSPSLHERDIKMMRSEKTYFTEKHANALALCAIRETQEETGLLIGVKTKAPLRKSINSAWRIFQNQQLLPNPSALHYFARAITPTGHIRRFDTRFFLTFAENINNIDEMQPSSELSNLQWVDLFSPPNIKIHDITKQIMEDTKDCITPNMALKQCHPVTLYYSARGRHYRKVRFS